MNIGKKKKKQHKTLIIIDDLMSEFGTYSK